MSVTVDVNVLVYASNAADPVHERAVHFVERLWRGPELVYLFWPAIMGYLRVVTHPAILPRPFSPTEAIHNLEEILDRAHVRTPGEAPGFWSVYVTTGGERIRGDGVPDAHLVALMRQHGVGTIYTRDRGFRRFDGIQIRDPFG